MKKNVRSNTPQEIRINSGRLRGRKLTFPSVEGLRPTLGRSRETLFNWLRPSLPDATCLDLFAGSGVLGMEAASVGAAQVVLVEQHAETAKHLAHSIDTLDLGDICSLEIADARSFLGRCHSSFDVIFVDPPFADNGLLETAVTAICESRLISDGKRSAAKTRLESGKIDQGRQHPKLACSGPITKQILRLHARLQMH